MLIDAKDKKVIIHESGVWMYADTSLGVTDESVILYLKNPQNLNIYESIRNETYPDMARVALKDKPIVKTTTAKSKATKE